MTPGTRLCAAESNAAVLPSASRTQSAAWTVPIVAPVGPADERGRAGLVGVGGERRRAERERGEDGSDDGRAERHGATVASAGAPVAGGEPPTCWRKTDGSLVADLERQQRLDDRRD